MVAVALGDPSVVAGMAGHSVVAERTGNFLVAEMAGHFPMTYRVALAPVEVPPARSLAAASVPMPLAYLRPRMMTMKKRSCDSWMWA